MGVPRVPRWVPRVSIGLLGVPNRAPTYNPNRALLGHLHPGSWTQDPVLRRRISGPGGSPNPFEFIGSKKVPDPGFRVPNPNAQQKDSGVPGSDLTGTKS